MLPLGVEVLALVHWLAGQTCRNCNWSLGLKFVLWCGVLWGDQLCQSERELAGPIFSAVAAAVVLAVVAALGLHTAAVIVAAGDAGRLVAADAAAGVAWTSHETIK